MEGVRRAAPQSRIQNSIYQLENYDQLALSLLGPSNTEIQ